MKQENDYVYDYDDIFEMVEDYEPGLTEDEKIEKLIRVYRPFLDMTDMDICHSLKGKWYFFRYSERTGNYEVFTQFETAAELIEIVVGELSMDAMFLVEEDFDIKPYLHCDLVNFMNQPIKYEDAVKELYKHLQSLFELSSKTY